MCVNKIQVRVKYTQHTFSETNMADVDSRISPILKFNLKNAQKEEENIKKYIYNLSKKMVHKKKSFVLFH